MSNRVQDAPHAVTDGDTVLATVDVAGPPDAAWRALTTTEVEHWWGLTDAYRMTEWTADLRVGGRWTVVIRHADGNAERAHGEFLQVDSGRKIVQTRTYDFDHPTLGRSDTTVTYRAAPIATGTRVTVRHDGFAGRDDAADEHAAGWIRVLGELATYLSRADV